MLGVFWVQVAAVQGGARDRACVFLHVEDELLARHRRVGRVGVVERLLLDVVAGVHRRLGGVVGGDVRRNVVARVSREASVAGGRAAPAAAVGLVHHVERAEHAGRALGRTGVGSARSASTSRRPALDTASPRGGRGRRPAGARTRRSTSGGTESASAVPLRCRTSSSRTSVKTPRPSPVYPGGSRPAEVSIVGNRRLR